MTYPRALNRKQLERKGIRIIVGVPMERNFRDVAFLHFWKIAQRGWPIINLVYGRTDANRNRMAHWLVNQDKYTHVCMLDGDHIHPENVVEALARWVADDPTRLVVGGLNYRRHAPYYPCIFRAAPDGKMHPPMRWADGLVPVDAIGHGAILIAKEALQQLPLPYWAYAYNHAEINEYPSEDMFFSMQCRKHGVGMWCDTSVTSPHIGDMFIDESAFRAFVELNPDSVQIVNGNGERTPA